MNCSLYVIDIAVAAVGLGVYLHLSDHDRKYVTRAEFDKHLAAIRVDLERLGASGRDVVRASADVDHADAGLPPVPDFHDGNGLAADVGNHDALAGTIPVPETAGHHARGDAEVHANAAAKRPDSVSDDGVHEVYERDYCANGDKDGGFCFHGGHYITINDGMK